MKALKIVGIALGALLLVVLAAVAFVASRFDADTLKAEAVKAVQEKTQRRIAIDGKLELAFWPNLAVKVGKLTLSEHKSDKQFLALDSARVSLAVMPLLSKQIVVNTAELAGLKLALVRRKDGSLNIADLLAGDPAAKPASPGEGPPPRIDIAAVKLTDGALAYRDEQSGASHAISDLDLATGRIAGDAGGALTVDALALSARGKLGADDFALKLEAPQLALAPGRIAGEKLTLTASLAGAKNRIAATLGLAGIEGGAQAMKIARLDLDLDAAFGEATVKGRLGSPVAVKVEATTLELPRLAGELDIASPQMPMKQVKLPIAGAARADWGRQHANLALETRFDESKIAAKLDLAKFAPPDIGFDLDIDRLDVDKYFPPTGKVGAGGTAAEPKIDFSALKNLKLRGTVKIGQLKARNVKAANLRFDINAAGGRLAVAPLSMNLYEGSLNGALTLDAAGNAVAVRQSLAGISINPLMKDALDRDLLAGRGTVNLDVTTRGDTVSAMKKALAGTASLSLKDGAVKGIDLAKSFRELKAKFSNKQDVVQAAKATDQTDFSELTASFKIANGVARNDDLAAKSPFLRLGGSGNVDIGNGRIDYLAKASVVNTSGGQGAKDLEHLKGVTVPVRLSGPFDNISWKLELGSLVQEAAKAKVEEKKQELKQKAQDKVKDKLKGLLGR